MDSVVIAVVLHSSMQTADSFRLGCTHPFLLTFRLLSRIDVLLLTLHASYLKCP